MKAVRWLPHALKNLADREIEREEAERTLISPQVTAPGQPGRTVFMRRYFDQVLQRQLLLRIIVEDSPDETVVVTIYKTSQIEKYLKGFVP